ncbi:DUF4142 domain-containing protein [Sphingomonas sabuli]|uniref:DUF4142 domain-containing protein n=1 Tax=Sphingomonas sabuli TaxID=2764186 RepID=A0A7G9L342_9SPHN|nr:DUF4142 domain-containing protein [Sphingomonas sabuli]QNM83041.1 DUF4142 domain-containing protein [Sphingomonas sabuli]
MNRHLMIAAAAAALTGLSAPASATLPTPSAAAATQDSQAFLFHAGAGDIFEVMTSMVIVQKSQNPQLRDFAAMLISDHTMMSNTALATAAGAGVMAPPPELSADQKAMYGRLLTASPASLDRLYLQQQVPAHQKALAMIQGYSQTGATPALRQMAAAAAPKVQAHLAQAQQMLASAR